MTPKIRSSPLADGARGVSDATGLTASSTEASCANRASDWHDSAATTNIPRMDPADRQIMPLNVGTSHHTRLVTSCWNYEGGFTIGLPNADSTGIGYHR